MGKAANVRLGWKKSVSTDIDKVQVIVTNDGTTTTSDLDASIEEFHIVVLATKAVTFKVTTYDTSGLQTTSITHDFVVGDLEAPQAATGLFHEILSIFDVPDAPPPGPPIQTTGDGG